MEQFFLTKDLSFPLSPSPFLNPIPEASFVPSHWHLVASEENNPELGGAGKGVWWGAAVPAGGRGVLGGCCGTPASLHPPIHPSTLPSIHPCVGEHLWSHPELDGTVGHRQGFCAAPTHSFAPCLSFPAGKQAPFPRSRLGTIANLAAVIAGVGSSITQSQDC